MFEVLRFVLRRGALSIADRAATSPLVAWTWSGAGDESYLPRLEEFRSTDSQTVIEMMSGKYLLGTRLIDTGGVSPFSIQTDATDWSNDLHGFGWLRHFRAVSDQGQRQFARTLVMDWIGRYGRYERRSWGVFVTARRVLNWLKNHSLLTENSGIEQQRTIQRLLGEQVQSLKVRVRFCDEPRDRLMARIALLGAALCAREDEKGIAASRAGLVDELYGQVDADGLHLSRNPLVQIQILSELIPVNRLLASRQPDAAAEIGLVVEAMHRALSRLMLGTREPAYFNGCGQVPVELTLAIAAQSGVRSTGSGLGSGYGVLVEGEGKLVADSGQVPPLAFSGSAHAGALAFEFACAGTLIVGNCGPAPAQLPESGNLFRHGSAHSAPTIDDLSSARIGGGGPLSDRARPRGAAPAIAFMGEENALEMSNPAYVARYGLEIRRRLTLMADGHTLVGQDRFVRGGRARRQQGDFSIRFHLGPTTGIERSEGEDLIAMHFRAGENWAFLWEGAEAFIEESVRHSAYFGLIRTRQIVLTGPARDQHEVAWVFTRQ